MKTLLLFVLAVSLSGCVTTKYHTEETKPDGTKLLVDASNSSPAFGAKSVGSADFKAGKVNHVTSEQSSMAEVINAAVAAGVAIGSKSVKP